MFVNPVFVSFMDTVCLEHPANTRQHNSCLFSFTHLAFCREMFTDYLDEGVMGNKQQGKG